MRATNIVIGGISAVLAAALMLSTGSRDISVASEHTGDTEISTACLLYTSDAADE